MAVDSFFRLLRHLTKDLDLDPPAARPARGNAAPHGSGKRLNDSLYHLKNVAETYERDMQARNTAEAKRNRHIAAVRQQRKTERILATDMPYSETEMARMVAHLRPGMPRSVIDEIKAQSHDILNDELLSGTRAWRAAYHARQPVSLSYTKDRLIDAVVFAAPLQDPMGLKDMARGGRVEDIYPNAYRVPEREVTGAQKRVMAIPDAQTHYLCFVTLFGGKLLETRFETDAAHQRFVKSVARRNAKIAQKTAEDRGTSVPATAAQPDPNTELRQALYDLRDRTGEITYGEIADWLIHKSTPDDWHVLLGANWDHGFAIPLWIIRQPRTQRASALKAFVQAQAHAYLGGASTHPEATAFCKELNQRLKDGFYRQGTGASAIAYTPPRYLETLEGDLRSTLAPAVFEALEGRAEHEIRTTMPDSWQDLLN